MLAWWHSGSQELAGALRFLLCPREADVVRFCFSCNVRWENPTMSRLFVAVFAGEGSLVVVILVI